MGFNFGLMGSKIWKKKFEEESKWDLKALMNIAEEVGKWKTFQTKALKWIKHNKNEIHLSLNKLN